MRVVKESPGRGRGVFATKSIPKGTVVEVSPVIVLKGDERGWVFDHYVYEFGKGREALALGVGSLFNHSKNQNLSVKKKPRQQELIFVARRDIKRGEELTIHYGYDPVGYDGQ